MACSIGVFGGRSSADDTTTGCRRRTRPVKNIRRIIRQAPARRVVFRRESNLRLNIKQLLPAQQLKNQRKVPCSNGRRSIMVAGGPAMKALEFQSQLTAD